MTARTHARLILLLLWLIALSIAANIALAVWTELVCP